MSWATWIALTFLSLWAVLALTWGIADRMVRRRMADLDELHAWREKVEAMRRLTDEEGQS